MVSCWWLVLLAVTAQAAAPQSTAAPSPGVRAVASGHTELLVATAFLDARTGFAVGGTRETGTPAILLRTEDGARTWGAIDTKLETRLYDVQFPTDQVGYAVGLHGAVLKTEDRGRTWRVKPAPGDVWLASVFFTSAKVGYAAGGAQDAMLLLETEDGAETWQSLVDRVPKEGRPRSLRDVRFLDADTGVAVGDEGKILVTEDAGNTWTPRSAGVDTWLRAITMAGDERWLVAGTGVVLGSEDAGRTWQRTPSPGNQKVNDLLFVDEQVGLLTTMDGELWWTRDSGKQWQPLHKNGGHALCGIAGVDRSLAYVVGESGTVLEIKLP